MAPYLIAFFGPDGSGKSTQVRLLANKFEDCDEKVKIVWIRSSHTLAYLVSSFLVKVGFHRVVSNQYGRTMKIPAIHTNRGLRLLWSTLEVVSVMPLILYRVYIPLSLGYTVVAERYVLDTIVGIAYYTNDLKFLANRTARFLLFFVPRKTIFIHLDSSYSAILRRRGRHVDSHHFIEFQRTAYKILGDHVGAFLIDTSNMSVGDTSNQIMTHFVKSCGLETCPGASADSVP